jgi:hypothetical protein
MVKPVSTVFFLYYCLIQSTTNEATQMKRTLTLALTAIVSIAAIGTFAVASGTASKELSNGHHMGQMSHGSNMGMGMMGGMYGESHYMDSMFDVNELTESLNLTNEQVSILSQLEASHLMIMAAMHENHEESDEDFGHHQMMTFMVENHEQMSEHMALYQQFADSLNEEQLTKWESSPANCHE